MVDVIKTVFDVEEAPKVTLTWDGYEFLAVVEISDLAPNRSPSAEEKALGIESLDPPTVRNSDIRDLIDACIRAVHASEIATTGGTGGPFAVFASGYRTAIAVRSALRQIDEDFA